MGSHYTIRDFPISYSKFFSEMENGHIIQISYSNNIPSFFIKIKYKIPPCQNFRHKPKQLKGSIKH